MATQGAFWPREKKTGQVCPETLDPANLPWTPGSAQGLKVEGGERCISGFGVAGWQLGACTLVSTAWHGGGYQGVGNPHQSLPVFFSLRDGLPSFSVPVLMTVPHSSCLMGWLVLLRVCVAREQWGKPGGFKT